MPASFEITTSEGRYPVTIATGCLDERLSRPGDAVFIVDAFFADRARSKGIDPIVITANEPAKALDRISEVIVALRDRGATRQTEIVAIGGGVIQDVASFVASVYMRGVRWSYVPTTLLGMADSCIGGKSSINVGNYKNIVGTIHPPARIDIDPSVAQTLAPEQRAEGLCEAAKICMCRGPEVFDAYLARDPRPDRDPEGLAEIVGLSLSTKKWFVEIDEFDKAERLSLNFGHGFGHALEAASGFRISHGIAVGLGMLAALAFGRASGRDYSRCPQIAQLEDYVEALIGVDAGLPAVLARLDPADLIDAFRADKKHRSDGYALILADAEGVISREFFPRDQSTEKRVATAFAAIGVGACAATLSRPLASRAANG